MKVCFEHPNKNRYNTRQDAETAAFLSREAGRPPLYIYKCDSCNGWHLTRRNPKR